MKTNKLGIYSLVLATLLALLFCNSYSIEQFYLSLSETLQHFFRVSIVIVISLAALFSLEAFSYDKKSGTESALLDIIEVEMGTVASEIFCSLCNVLFPLLFMLTVISSLMAESFIVGIVISVAMFFIWCITYFALFFLIYLIRDGKNQQQFQSVAN